MRQAGYRTEAIVAGGHLAPAFGFAHSFDRYQSTTDFGGLQETVPLAMKAMDRLAEGDDPWLLFVHGYDCHTPYPKPGPFYRLEQPDYTGPVLEAARQPLTWERIWGDRWYPDFSPQIVRAADQHSFLPVEVFDQLAAHAATPGVRSQALSEEDLSFLLGTYDVAVRQADHHLGRLLDHLETLDLEEDTVVAVFSDHGEDLLAHQTFNHRVGTYDENLQVVLVLRVPGEAPRDEASPVALFDLSATLARLAGLQWRGRGRDLLGPADPTRAIYSESLRGEASIRTAEGRLNLPAASATSWPPPEDPRSWLRDGEGRLLSLSDPRAAELHRLLLQERPPW
jgi:arylsulfatase A-like enzyme